MFSYENKLLEYLNKIPDRIIGRLLLFSKLDAIPNSTITVSYDRVAFNNLVLGIIWHRWNSRWCLHIEFSSCHKIEFLNFLMKNIALTH